jgi:manganese/zinc/iron transport system substrate-binding protein
VSELASSPSDTAGPANAADEPQRGGRARAARRGLLAVVVALLAATATACTSSSDAAAGDLSGRTVRVATTTNFISDTVARIGGERVEVTGLMGPGVDPHLYQASAGDVQTLREADVIFYGGLQLEGKMADLLDQLGQEQPTVAVTRDLPRERLLEPAANVPEQYDPHVWFDVALWVRAAGTIADTLKERDPEHAALYQTNLEAFLTDLRELDRYVTERIAAVPEERRVLITSHDAFEYFGRAYDIEVDAIQGISTAAEATTADIERIAALIAARGVPAVFVESSVPRQTIDALIAAAAQRGAQVRVGGELYSDAAGDPGTPEGTYVGMVRANADRIAEGLGG